MNLFNMYIYQLAHFLLLLFLQENIDYPQVIEILYFEKLKL